MAPVQDPTQHGRILAGLSDLFADKTLTDVTLVAGDTQIQCHRCVLAACSPYFRAMFINDHKESRSDRVELHNVPPKLLRPLVDYIYNGSVDINNDIVQDLMVTANLLELIELCNICAQYMVGEIHVSNCVALFVLASNYHHEYILEKAMRFILKNFQEVSESGDLSILAVNDILRILAEDDLDIRCEEIVFNTVVKWVEHDINARKKHLPKLLETVRLGLLSEDFMSSVVEQCDLIMKDPFCRSMISLARLQVVSGGTINLVNDEENDEDSSSTQSRLRYGMHRKMFMTCIGASQKKDIKGLGCFDPKTMKNYYAIQLHFGFDFTHRIDYHRAVVTAENQIFLAGGILFENYELSRSGETSREVSVFAPYTKSWVMKSPMNDRRCAHGLVTIENHIFAIGGKSNYPEGEPLTSVEIYDIDSDKWSYGADMPQGRSMHQTLVYKGKIIVVGGYKNDGATGEILQFDPEENLWETLDIKLETPRAEHAAVIRGEELFIIGGTNGDSKLSSMEIFNLESKKWSRGADFVEDRTCSAMFLLDDEIYFCGGMRTVRMRSTGQLKEMTSRDFWRYDAKENSWTQMAKLVPYANTHALVVAEHNVKELVESEFVSKMDKK